MFANPRHKSIEQIAKEWDRIAPVRIQQILSGKDITFDYVLMPSIGMLLEGSERGSLLDAGCGVGVMASKLGNTFKEVIGIDPSSRSIEIARSNFGGSADFHITDIEHFSRNNKKRFDVILANMVLMDAPNLDAFIRAVRRLLKPRGKFIFSITHPFFWPDYYGYQDESWYEYSKELFVESPFRISNYTDCQLVSTHIHRPVSKYVSTFGEAGLCLDRVLEPMPALAVDEMYPSKWQYPRYLLGLCHLSRSKAFTS